MCAQCNLVTSKGNKILMLCIYIQLCTVLRKAKQDDSELLMKACCLFKCPRKSGNTFINQFACCHFWLLFLFIFLVDREQFLFFFRFSGGSARASERRHDKRGRLKPSVTRVLLGGPRKKRDWLSSNLCALLFPEVCYFCLFYFFLTGHCRHHHAELL